MTYAESARARHGTMASHWMAGWNDRNNKRPRAPQGRSEYGREAYIDGWNEHAAATNYSRDMTTDRN